MQRTLACFAAGMLLSSLAASAAAPLADGALRQPLALVAAGTTTTGVRSLSAGFSMTPTRRRAAGYAKVDNALAGMAETAARAPKAQLAAALQQSAPGARLALRDPLLVPAVLVDISVKGQPAAAAAALRKLGMQHVTVFSNLVSGYLPVDQIKSAAGQSGVRFMRTSRARAHTGSITSQGDFIQHSDLLRASTLVPGLSGQGITVGVLSDSFNCTTDPAAYSDDVRTGDLPANVNVLEEYDSGEPANPCHFAADEGRAIEQIVWDVAPGTQLAFHTAFNGEADFAQGILDLANIAGAKVIDDDVGYFDEPIYQDGIVAQAVDTVKAQGVAYFSSAGNSGRQSYEADYKDSGTVGATGADNEGEKLMAFTSSDGATTQNWLPFSVPGGFQEQSVQILEWDQPYVTGAPNSGGATSSIDICLTDSTGAVIPTFCSGPNPVGGDPVSITGLDTDGTTTAYGLQIGIVGGTPPPGHIKIIFQDDGGGSQADPAFATYSSTIQGHPAAAGGMAVGASYFRANPVCLPAVYPDYTLEGYSSAGGSPVLFDVNGAPLANPVTRQKPNFVAPDGGNTTFFAQILGGRSNPILQCANAPGTWNFFGTSAAAPHAAGVAALLMQAQPAATPDLVYNALQNTALVTMDAIDPTDTVTPIPQTAVNFDTGFGYLRADLALNQVIPLLSLSSSSVAFGDQRVGVASAVQTVTVTNNGGFAAAIGAVTASDGFAQTNDCPASLAPQATCTISVTATPAAAGAGSGTLSIASSAPNSPNAAALSVNGVQSKVLLSPKSVSFGQITVGSSASKQVISLVQTVTLVNTGDAPLNISGISSADPAFTQTNTCGSAVAAGASCAITIDFSPTAAKDYASALTVASDGAAGGDSQVAASGTGVSSSGGGAFAPWLLLPGLFAAWFRRRKRD